ncbi:hypothetical protein SUGI_0287250 [Cryptomeria japonica]|uniref:cell number regulator 13 isoform X2 n=1 Tax=Cryptomeria japonica TaxID=3369 RepID=UPI002408B52A|nr:cell number regulator 13 isoform X2 [Cryptomeria japonica]GLJ16717.1 hypothetical protein SUGI_0287250 [Cryptomeria japonica]
MGLGWNMTELGNAAQLTGLDAVGLIGAIVKVAKNARMHKKNCKQFAQHLKLIGNLLQQLKLPELKKRPETSEPLEQLEDTLRKAYVLVHSCENKSYLYLLAFGWNIVHQFKETQAEIDSLLRLIPLITLVEHHQERLYAIEKDEKEYTMGAEEAKLQETILKSECSETDTRALKHSLSRSYPGLSFHEALQKENEKLCHELEHMQLQMDLDKCDVIRHLIGVTESASTKPQEKTNKKQSIVKFNVDSNGENAIHDKVDAECVYIEPLGTEIVIYKEQDASSLSYNVAYPRWRNRIFHFYRDPGLCLFTCMYPCGTFVDIAEFVSDGKVSKEEALNNFLSASLVLSCFFYSCCVRRRLRKRFNIPGGSCDDYWAHALCFPCALIQEWSEITAREDAGDEPAKMEAPTEQYMDR